MDEETLEDTVPEAVAASRLLAPDASRAILLAAGHVRGGEVTEAVFYCKNMCNAHASGGQWYDKRLISELLS